MSKRNRDIGVDPIDTEYEDLTSAERATAHASGRKSTGLQRLAEVTSGSGGMFSLATMGEEHDLQPTGHLDWAKHGEPIYACTKCGTSNVSAMPGCPGARPIETADVLPPPLAELYEKLTRAVLAAIEDASPKQIPQHVATAIESTLTQELALVQAGLGKQASEARREAAIALRGEVEQVQGLAHARDRASQSLRSEMNTTIMQSPEIDAIGALDVALATGALDVWAKNYRAWRFGAQKKWGPS